MLYSTTLNEITNNINTGVEYEIALFYKLLKNNVSEQTHIMSALKKRYDYSKIKIIISLTNISIIERELQKRGLELYDCSFETQNDDVGPSDIVMYVRNNRGQKKEIGLSVKYANTCTLNVTGKNFITDSQIKKLRELLPLYSEKYIKEMTNTYGDVKNWFRMRKPSTTTDEYIDLIRDEVIANWKNVNNKSILLSALFHSNSPIEFWVITYNDYGYTLKTAPQTIDLSRANDIVVKKYRTSLIAFYLDDIMIGHMQVKFNNGFIEKCKKQVPDITWQGVNMSYGKPFSSWNFSVEK